MGLKTKLKLSVNYKNRIKKNKTAEFNFSCLCLCTEVFVPWHQYSTSWSLLVFGYFICLKFVKM